LRGFYLWSFRRAKNNERKNNMRTKPAKWNPIVYVIALSLLFSGAWAAANQGPPNVATDNNAAKGDKTVRINYENLTDGQIFSPSVFFSHNASAVPLFTEGKKAPFGMMRIAEEGNIGPLLSEVVVHSLGGAYGSVIQGVSTLPGHSRTVELTVDAQHPMISGAFMLVMTNDGFTGISALDAYNLAKPVAMDLYAYDAGTENNNEDKDHLIAFQGTERAPEKGVVHRHQGIKGDKDAPPSWRFDPQKPVGRITITPIQ
jgi:hypothetical protein